MSGRLLNSSDIFANLDDSNHYQGSGESGTDEDDIALALLDRITATSSNIVSNSNHNSSSDNNNNNNNANNNDDDVIPMPAATSSPVPSDDSNYIPSGKVEFVPMVVLLCMSEYRQ